MNADGALIVFASEEGQTAKVADALAEGLNEAGIPAFACGVGEAPASLDAYRLVVIGGSVHVGQHARTLEGFVRAHRDSLAGRPTGFFSVSLSAVKQDARHQADAHRMADAFLATTGWRPDAVACFGGALRYSRYSRPKRWLLRAIARHEGADTDTSHDWEYTDWDAVRAFAGTLAALVAAPATPAGRGSPIEA